MQIRNNVRERRRERIQKLIGQFAHENTLDATAETRQPQSQTPLSQPPHQHQPTLQPQPPHQHQPPQHPHNRTPYPVPVHPVANKPSLPANAASSFDAEPDPELWWKERQRSRKNAPAGWQGMKGLPQTSRAPGENAAPPGRLDAPKFVRGFTLRLAAAATVFAIAWLGVQLKLPGSEPAKAWLVSSVSTDMDFQAIEAWYGETFGGTPSFFPFSREDDPDTKEVAAGLDAADTVPPVDGRVVESFAQSGDGVKLAAAGGSEVRTVYAGRVQQIVSGTDGITVLVQHPNQVVSAYGSLAEASVKKDDWVETGDKLGELKSAGEGEAQLKFSIRQNGKPLDPADVVPFD